MSETAVMTLMDRRSYQHWTHVSLRYGDTDKLGHINNAVFVTLLEAGRVSVLFDNDGSIARDSKTFVIANLKIDFRAEMHFPGTAEIGTALLSIGRSSVKLVQAIFKDGICCATSESTIVLIDENTRKPSPISDEVRAMITKLAPPLSDSSHFGL